MRQLYAGHRLAERRGHLDTETRLVLGGEEKNLTNAVPASSVIAGWIEAAKSTGGRITY